MSKFDQYECCHWADVALDRVESNYGLVSHGERIAFGDVAIVDLYHCQARSGNNTSQPLRAF